MWCIPTITPEFTLRMENVLALYARPYNPDEPVLCFDEKSKELHNNARKGTPCSEGKVRRKDYEYIRNGTRNIFMVVEPKGGYRSAIATARRTKRDYAEAIERIVTLQRYRHATLIHIVQDNLNTHGAHSLIETFGKRKAARIMTRIRFHHTPKHASWLNMAEIELSVMERQCTKKRIPDARGLRDELAAWEKRRNAAEATINWAFTVADARRVFKYAGGQN